MLMVISHSEASDSDYPLSDWNEPGMYTFVPSEDSEPAHETRWYSTDNGPHEKVIIDRTTPNETRYEIDGHDITIYDK
jgi:hypothetical protein